MDITPRQLEILQYAADLLINHGVQALTIKKLSQKMGFSEAALYRHFESKDAIVIALLRYMINNTNERLLVIVETEKGAEYKLQMFVQQQVAYMSENRHFLLIMFAESIISENETINQVVREIMGMIKGNLLKIMIQGQEEGNFRKDILAEELTLVMIGTFRLQILQWKMSGFGFDIKSRSETMVQSIIKLLSI